MPVGVVSAGYAKLGTFLYVAGGKTGSGPTDRVTDFQRYDMVNDGWESLADVPGTAREDIALAAHDGLIYAFGGATTDFDSGDSQVAAVYDPATDTWNDSAVTDLDAGVSAAQAVSWNETIWIIGGFDVDGNSLDQVLIYDDPDGPAGPTVGTYSPGPSLPVPRDSARVAIQDGGTATDRLYVLGGRYSQSPPPLLTKVNSWVLNPTNDDWDDIAPLPTARRNFVVGTVGDKIQVFGGEREGTGAEPTVDEYDPILDEWTTLTGYDWPSPKHGASGAQAQVDGEVVVFLAGGATQVGADSTVTDNDSFTRAFVP